MFLSKYHSLERAYAFFIAGDYHKAGQLYEQRISIIKDQINKREKDKYILAEAYCGVGRCCFRLKKYQDAVKNHELAIKYNPKVSPQAYIDIGDSYIRAVPNQILTYYILNFHNQAKNYIPPAIRFVRQVAIKMQMQPLTGVGNIYQVISIEYIKKYISNYYNKAIVNYNKSIQLYPEVPSLYINRGDVYSIIAYLLYGVDEQDPYYKNSINIIKKHTNRALEDYMMAIKLNSKVGNTRVYMKIAFQYYNLDFRDKALEYCNKVKRIDPNNFEAHDLSFDIYSCMPGKVIERLIARKKCKELSGKYHLPKNLAITEMNRNRFSLGPFYELDIEDLKGKIFQKDISKW